MDLGTLPLFDLTAPAAEVVEECTEPVALSRSQELLVEIRDHRTVIAEREIATVRAIAEWAAEHVVTDEADASTLTTRGLDTGLLLAGPGAPLISDFAVMELSALLGRSLDSGRCYVGQVIELAYRLPETWARVLEGQVPVWKALRVADVTRVLPQDAAGFVDRQLAPFAHGMTWVQVERLVEEALVRFDPAAAEERRREAQDLRHFDIDLDQTGFDGTAHISGTLDTADALDLENAIARRAKVLGELGCVESLDVRRSIAAGELARTDLALDLEVSTRRPGRSPAPCPAARPSSSSTWMRTIRPSAGSGTPAPRSARSRSRPGSTPPAARVIIRPVLDLNSHQPVDSYEIPDRIRRHVTLRDHHCVFPHCTKPAERCDLDHVVPHGDGGPTCQCNLAPDCRGHHRFKTSGQMTCQVLTPGTYQWTSASGRQWVVDPTGTHDL